MIDSCLWVHPAVVGKHVVSMTRDYEPAKTVSVATCQCGWQCRVPRDAVELQNRAVDAHWLSEIDAAVVQA